MNVKVKKQKKPVLVLILLSAYALLSLYPLFYLIAYSLKTSDEIFFTNPFGLPTQPRFDNYLRAVQGVDLLLLFKNSAFVTFFSCVGIVVLAIPFSYAVTRMQWKAKKAVSTYIALGLFIPVQVIIIPLSILVKNLHLANTHFALIVPYIAFGLAMSTMIVGNGFLTLPRELEESAFLDGAGIFRTFFSIMLPLVKPSVATSLLFAVIANWNEYTLASIMISDNKLKTIQVGLASFSGETITDWGAIGACLVLASIPTILMYLVFSEQVENALTVSGAVKG